MDLTPGMSRSDRHVHDTNLILHLPDHNACLAGMGRHPMENSGRRAHGIGAIEFHSCSRSSHGHRGVAAEHGIAVSGHWKWPGEWPEIRGRIFIADSRDPNVFRHDGFPFLLELLSKNLLQCLETNAHHAETSAERERVLGHFVSSDVRQLGDGKRAKLQRPRRRHPA